MIGGRPSRTLAALGLALAVSATAQAGDTVRAAFSGSVRDTLGRFVSGVEVLLVDPVATAVPAAAARTDGAGRFAVLRLQPGVYQIAAVKGGYDTFVGHVDTVVRDSIDLVLRPSVAVDPQTLPVDSSWALRLPQRGVLRDLEASPESAPEPSVPSGFDSLKVRFDQMLSVGGDLSGSRTGAAQLEASETRLKVAARLGSQATLVVQGRHEDLGTPRSSTDSGRATADRGGRAAWIGLSYDLPEGSRLAVSARMTRSEYRIAAPEISRFEQDQQSWGYDAGWTKDLGGGQRLALAVDYGQAVLSGVPAEPGSAIEVGAQWLGAQGSYRYAGAEDHDVSVELRAEALPRVWESDIVGAAAPALGLSLQTDDRWSVAGPLSLTYGLALRYRQTEAAQQARVVSPRAGADFEAAGWVLRGMVSYDAVSGTAGDPLAGDAPLILARDPVGYEAQIEVPLASHLKLEGSSRHAPVETGLVGYLPGVERFGEDPFYVTNRSVAVSERRMALVEERGSTTAFLEWTEGRAEGTLSPILGFAGTEVPAERDAEYRGARMGVMAPSLGTDVTVEYRRLTAGPGKGVHPVAAARQESVEVRVAKHLSTSRRMGDWRMLLALHVSSIQTQAVDPWEPYGAGEAITALNRRLSGGVSVLF